MGLKVKTLPGWQFACTFRYEASLLAKQPEGMKREGENLPWMVWGGGCVGGHCGHCGHCRQMFGLKSLQKHPSTAAVCNLQNLQNYLSIIMNMYLSAVTSPTQSSWSKPRVNSVLIWPKLVFPFKKPIYTYIYEYGELAVVPQHGGWTHCVGQLAANKQTMVY